MEKTVVKNRLRALKNELVVLYFAYRDPQTPLYAKIFSAIVVVYALSPIDLIPDFIPVLGYLDDLIIIPLGIYLALKMIPSEVMNRARKRASAIEYNPVCNLGILIVVGVWATILFMCGFVIYRYMRQNVT